MCAFKVKKLRVNRPTSFKKVKGSPPPSALKNKRLGQTNKWKNKNQYVKGGKLHQYSLMKDRAIKSKRTRKPNQATWRGDLPNSTL